MAMAMGSVAAELVKAEALGSVVASASCLAVAAVVAAAVEATAAAAAVEVVARSAAAGSLRTKMQKATLQRSGHTLGAAWRWQDWPVQGRRIASRRSTGQ